MSSSTNGFDDPWPFHLTPLFDTEEPALFPVGPELVVAEPPALQDVLCAAALLWCTHSQWPTVRAIAACAGVSPSTVLWPFGTAEQMRQALVTAERTALAALVSDSGGDRQAAAEQRVLQLCAYDVRLSRLPLVAALAAGVHDAEELAALASAVRGVPVP